MANVIRALNVLSAVIMLAAAVCILMAFWVVLSLAAQALIGVTVLSYYFVQIDLCAGRHGRTGNVRGQ